MLKLIRVSLYITRVILYIQAHSINITRPRVPWSISRLTLGPHGANSIGHPTLEEILSMPTCSNSLLDLTVKTTLHI